MVSFLLGALWSLMVAVLKVTALVLACETKCLKLSFTGANIRAFVKLIRTSILGTFFALFSFSKFIHAANSQLSINFCHWTLSLVKARLNKFTTNR